MRARWDPGMVAARQRHWLMGRPAKRLCASLTNRVGCRCRRISGTKVAGKVLAHEALRGCLNGLPSVFMGEDGYAAASFSLAGASFSLYQGRDASGLWILLCKPGLDLRIRSRPQKRRDV